MYDILIVEDEAPIANLIRMSLTQAGYRCTIASDGDEGADWVERRRFDLILLDVMLPHTGDFSHRPHRGAGPGKGPAPGGGGLHHQAL